MTSRSIVAIDARMVGEVPHGIARYVSRLAAGLRRLSSERSSLAYNPVFLMAQDFSGQDFFGHPIQKINAPFLSLRELIALPSALKGKALYHSPSFSSLMSAGPLRSPCPWIVTIHDLNHLSFGGGFQKLYYERLLKIFALRAAKVATVSEFSRTEIAFWLKCDPSKIEVVYNALEPGGMGVHEARRSLSTDEQTILTRHRVEPGKYFFCLSNPKPHKNVSFLIDAYREAKSEWPLILSMKEFADVPGVRAIGALVDKEVQALRSNAGAIVFPSLYEGFGLPPVEAALAGVPLIVSDIPPHREGLVDLGPDEARWIDPKNRRSLVDALVAAQAGGIRGARLDSRQKIADRFSEIRLATRMDQIYARVLERGHDSHPD